MSFVIVDIETTGLSKERHSITEIAAARVINGQIGETFQTLVNPNQPIPRFITKLTGITNEMVQDAPQMPDAMSDFITFIGDDTIVAHNATFDYGFLSHNARKCGCAISNNVLCTVKLARRLVPDLPSRKLSTICEYFSIENNDAHRALSDVMATAHFFTKLMTHLEKHEMHELPHLIKISHMPCSKIPTNLFLR